MVLATQHVLGSTISLFTALESCGVVPEDIFIVAKAYSSSSEALAAAIARGYRLFGGNEVVADRIPYEAELRAAIQSALNAISHARIGASNPGRLVVIDDGALALEVLSREYPDLLSSCVAVEQTTRGIRTLTAMPLDIAVANIGRCTAKLEVEAPYIAESMVIGLISELKQLRSHGVDVPGTLQFVGFGAVGARTARALREMDFDVSIVETDPHTRGLAEADGFHVEAAVGKFSDRAIICGATGRSWFRQEWIERLDPNTVLVNMASSDIEFAAWNLRPGGVPINADQRLRTRPWMTTYKIGRRAAGPVWLARGGFPINFTGGLDPIDPQKIQVTRALLLAGALQVAKARRPGLFAPTAEIQQLIVSTTRQALSNSDAL